MRFLSGETRARKGAREEVVSAGFNVRHNTQVEVSHATKIEIGGGYTYESNDCL